MKEKIELKMPFSGLSFTEFFVESLDLFFLGKANWPENESPSLEACLYVYRTRKAIAQ